MLCFSRVWAILRSWYPSWHNLAKRTYEQLMQDGLVADTRSYESYLEQKKYPELFRQAEVDIGGREKLIGLLKPLLIPETKGHGFIYEMLSKWPLACYLTTNFDDELASYLERIGEHFSILRNRREDFYPIRDGASHLIQKLHSDLNHPDEVVLTSADYRRFYIDDECQYFRDKLRQVMEMFDIFVIGHSLSDPDIDYILQMARKTASPIHPIYMISSDYNQADEREFLERFNIVLLRYPNPDGKHAQLRKLLSLANKFIVPRGRWKEKAPSEALPIEEMQAASALFMFRRLQPAKSAAIFTPLILPCKWQPEKDPSRQSKIDPPFVIWFIANVGDRQAVGRDKACSVCPACPKYCRLCARLPLLRSRIQKTLLSLSNYKIFCFLPPPHGGFSFFTGNSIQHISAYLVSGDNKGRPEFC